MCLNERFGRSKAARRCCSKIGIEPWSKLEAAGIRPNGEHGMERIEDAVIAVWREMLESGQLSTPAKERRA